MEISFHGCNFPSFFTGVSYFSRVGSEIFSRVVPSFHGSKTENFHGWAHFFHGKKKKHSQEFKKADLLLLLCDFVRKEDEGREDDNNIV